MNTHTRFQPAGAILSGLLALAALGTFYWSFQHTGEAQLGGISGSLLLALGSFCVLRRKDDLVHDFFLPVILFAALGGFSWAVRGCSGFGAVKGCVFAGVLWGTAWWFIARNRGADQNRRYASGWIVLALTIGIGLSGARGWAQWPNFFQGKLFTNADAGEFVEISPVYGFVWLFIAGVPWAGIGACLLAWCASERPLAAWKWGVRLFCGFGTAFFLHHLFQQHPNWFLPLYSSLEDRYTDIENNPTLRRVINDNTAAIRHMGLFLGFLLFELGRRDWRNATLISTVGVLNGVGWALFQNWKWAEHLFPDDGFNWWRCWESSGGISIGIAYGVAYYLVNRPRTDGAPPVATASRSRTILSLIYDLLGLLLMITALVWYLVEAGGSLAGAEWRRHLVGAAFAATLLAGIVLFGRHLWNRYRGMATPDSGEAADPLVPSLKSWLPRYGLLLLITGFLTGSVRVAGEGAAAVWWTRFDYYLIAVTAGYGVLYLLAHGLRSLSSGRSSGSGVPRLSVFLRYPNLDWLAVYLLLLVLATSYLFPGEIPPWKGWFNQANDAPPLWYGLLAPGLLGLFGLLYFLLSLLPSRETVVLEGANTRRQEPNLERLGVYLGLLVGLGLSIKNGSRGWANLYLTEWGDERYWGDMYWRYTGPVLLVLLGLTLLLVLVRRISYSSGRDTFPHAGWLMALVLVVQNVIGQAVTGPHGSWSEVAFSLYYLLLFLLSAVILYHYHDRKRLQGLTASAPLAAGGVGLESLPVVPEDQSDATAATPGDPDPRTATDDLLEAAPAASEDAEAGFTPESEAPLEEETSGWTPEIEGAAASAELSAALDGDANNETQEPDWTPEWELGGSSAPVPATDAPGDVAAGDGGEPVGDEAAPGETGASGAISESEIDDTPMFEDTRGEDVSALPADDLEGDTDPAAGDTAGSPQTVAAADEAIPEYHDWLPGPEANPSETPWDKDAPVSAPDTWTDDPEEAGDVMPPRWLPETPDMEGLAPASDEPAAADRVDEAPGPVDGELPAADDSTEDGTRTH